MRRHILIFCVTGLHTQHVSVISDQPPCALSKDLRILLGFRLYVHSFFYYVTFRNEMYSKVNKLVLILLITQKTVPLLCICQSLIYNHSKNMWPKGHFIIKQMKKKQLSPLSPVLNVVQLEIRPSVLNLSNSELWERGGDLRAKEK